MRAILFSALVLTVATGCMSGAANPSLGSEPTGGSGNVAGQPASLSFRDDDTNLTPGEMLELVVDARPAGQYLVRFALPKDSESDPLDAVLERSEVPTDESGRASVFLTAPNTSTTFKVRASIAGNSSSVERELTVTDGGTVKVRVQPIYQRNRIITTWHASARPNDSCANYSTIPVPDNDAITALSASTEAPELSGVPVGVPVAITLRSGQFVGGCTSIEMFRPGLPNNEQVVEVTVMNRPIELAQSNVDLSLQLDPNDVAFRAMNQAASNSALVALRGSSTDDADALLDAMRSALTGQARQDLDTARKNEDWDTLLRAYWGSPTRLHDSVSAWLVGGKDVLAQSPDLLLGRLSAVDAKSAELTLQSVAGLLPAEVGFVSSSLVSWSAAADDTISAATDVYLSSSRFASGLAAVAALDAFPSADGAEQALALSLDCSGLSATLAAAGTDSVLAYPTCNATCLAELCEKASATLWQRARDATSTQPLRLALTATGSVENVGDAAQVEGIKGSWVGELTGSPQSTGGPLLATGTEP